LRKAIVTFGVGGSRPLLDISLPTFRRYADAHGYELVIGEPPASANVSWRKLPLLIELFREGYDALVWIDADIVVLRYDRDILDDSPHPLGLVVHEVPEGKVPNCGLMVLRWPLGIAPLVTAQAVAEARQAGGRPFRRAEWWEQAAIIEALGGDPDADMVDVPQGAQLATGTPLRAWGGLPYVWNPHPHDYRGHPVDARCFHATMCARQCEAMAEAVMTAEREELWRAGVSTTRASAAIAAGQTFTMS
jgi:hypothetical protein